MNKTTFYLIILTLISQITFAQLFENFEGTTIPSGGNWLLDSGTWKVYDNGIGTNETWNANLSINSCNGRSAYLNRENVAEGTFAEDWLVTPMVTVPNNGQLRFITKQTLAANFGSIYTIRISTTSQTNISAFTTIQTWDETELNAVFNECEEKIVSLSNYANQQIYIAFVMSNDNGDRWVIDDVNVVEQCLDPTVQTATNPTLTGSTLGWGNPSSASQWEVEITASGATPTGTGILTTSNPYTVTGLTEGTCYDFYVRALCTSGTTSVNSEWVGPFNFCTIAFGESCQFPIVVPDITAGAYITTNDTSAFGNSYNGSPGVGCGTTQQYLNGNEVFYQFTSTTGNPVTVTSQTNTTFSGLFIYSDCSNVGVSCVAGTANGNPTNNTPDNLVFTPTIGQNYYIVISTNSTPQSTPYTLSIFESNCTNLTASFSVLTNCPSGTNTFFVTANVSNMGTATSISGTTNPVSSLETITEPGVIQFGPFPNDTPVVIYLHNDQDANCFRISPPLTQTSCPCANNINANFEVLSNCQNVSDTFFINTDLLSMGSATSIVATTTPASTSQIITNTGQFQFGPFPNGTDVVVNLQNQQDLDCYINSSSLTQSICPCNSPIATFDVVSNCSSGTETFFVTTNVSNMGSATSLEATTIPASTSQILTSAGQLQFGPFPNGTNVAVKLQNQQNINCTKYSSYMTLISCHTMEFNTFLDLNNDNIQQTNEPNYTNGTFEINKNNSANPTFINTSNGSYLLYPVDNNDLIDASFILDSQYIGYLNSAIIYNDISVSGTSSNNEYLFPITITNPFSDVSGNLIGLLQPRPGFIYKNRIIFKNNGVSPTSGTISFTKDSNVTMSTVSDPLAVLNPNGFTLNYTNLLPQETRQIDVEMSVPNIPIVNLGDLLTNSISITSTTTDVNLLNNATSLSEVVVGSYDPNDKMEAHGENININSFTTDDYLYYTIRFQNTGTADAINVEIQDLLDSQLNVSTLRMIDVSHDYVLTKDNNQLIWNFDNIFLPSESQSVELSQGYVSFKIKPYPGYAVNDMIPNTAEIYFDFNPAIITNTFQTTFVNPLSNENFLLNEITIYPNPTNNILNINYGTSAVEIKSVQIHDLLGKIVYQSQSKVETIDLSNFKSGIYLLDITTESNGKITKKLIKN